MKNESNAKITHITKRNIFTFIPVENTRV